MELKRVRLHQEILYQKIAKRYKTSTDEIAKNNNIKDVSKIFPGQHLTIYGAKTNSPLIYIVVPGDTLAKIAEKKWCEC
nr:LysM domain-containing protein [Klebsiella pneumoniae]